MDIVAHLKQTDFLNGLDDDIYARLQERFEIHEFVAGETIFRAGSPATSLGFVCSGLIEVWRDDIGIPIKLQTLSAGDWFGEVAALGSQARSASLQAHTDTTIALMQAKDFISTIDNNNVIDPLERVLLQLHASQYKWMVQAGQYHMEAIQKELNNFKIRSRSGAAIGVLVSLMSTYAYIRDMVSDSAGKQLEVLSLLIAGFASLGAASYIRSANLPWAEFGITFQKTGKSLQAALVWTLPLCAFMTVSKVMGQYLIPSWSTQPLLEWPALTGTFALWGLAYLLSSFIQELAARSFLHTAFAQILHDPREIWSAVLSNLVFSVFHLHYNPSFAALTFLFGLCYSAFWIRHRNLIAISVLHFLTGIWAMDVLLIFQLPGLAP